MSNELAFLLIGAVNLFVGAAVFSHYDRGDIATWCLRGEVLPVVALRTLIAASLWPLFLLLERLEWL